MASSMHTKVVHAGMTPEATTGAIMPPIFLSSTYAQQAPGVHQGYEYSRAANPTRSLVEQALAILEDSKHALLFASGLAAEQAVIQLLTPPQHIICCDDVYGGTGRMFLQLYARYGFTFDFIDMSSQKCCQQIIRQKPALVWVETPSNPMLKLADIKQIANSAHKVGALLVVDNTFATPVFQQPLQLGADIVIHSTTKYLSGHTDLIGGAVTTSNVDLYKRLQFIQFAAGAILSPFDSYLLLRSLKTLAVRMQQHQHNALHIAKFLTKHPRVNKVIYPGLSSHPQHLLAKKQMQGFSGIISFTLKGNYDDVVKFCQNLKLFTLAESLGGVESMINHPEKMTHASVPEKLREKLHITPELLRLSIGIEDHTDLINDLTQAFCSL